MLLFNNNVHNKEMWTNNYYQTTIYLLLLETSCRCLNSKFIRSLSINYFSLGHEYTPFEANDNLLPETAAQQPRQAAFVHFPGT